MAGSPWRSRGRVRRQAGRRQRGDAGVTDGTLRRMPTTRRPFRLPSRRGQARRSGVSRPAGLERSAQRAPPARITSGHRTARVHPDPVVHTGRLDGACGVLARGPEEGRRTEPCAAAVGEQGPVRDHVFSPGRDVEAGARPAPRPASPAAARAVTGEGPASCAPMDRAIGAEHVAVDAGPVARLEIPSSTGPFSPAGDRRRPVRTPVTVRIPDRPTAPAPSPRPAAGDVAGDLDAPAADGRDRRPVRPRERRDI